MSSIRFSCENCHQTIKADRRQAGSKGRCPGCKKPLLVPFETSLRPLSDEFPLAALSLGGRNRSGVSGREKRKRTQASPCQVSARASRNRAPKRTHTTFERQILWTTCYERCLQGAGRNSPHPTRLLIGSNRIRPGCFDGWKCHQDTAFVRICRARSSWRGNRLWAYDSQRIDFRSFGITGKHCPSSPSLPAEPVTFCPATIAQTVNAKPPVVLLIRELLQSVIPSANLHRIFTASSKRG